jgi:hypothetical protein
MPERLELIQEMNEDYIHFNAFALFYYLIAGMPPFSYTKSTIVCNNASQ